MTVPAAAWTLAGTVAGSLLTHLFAGPRFKKERLWEARTKAYGIVVNHITKAAHCAARLDQDFQENHPEQVFQSDRYNELAGAAWRHYRKAMRELRRSYVAFSDTMLAKMEKLDADTDRIEWDDDDPDDKWSALAERFVAAKAELALQARRELAPKGLGRVQSLLKKRAVEGA